MAKSKGFSVLGIFKNLFQAYIKRFQDISYLFSLEARLATKTLVTIAILTVVALMLLAFCWLSLLMLLFFFLVFLQYSFLFSSFIILIANLILLTIVYIFIAKNKKNLTFSATRRQIANMTSLKKDS